MSELEPRQLPLREAGIRILDRRPDLSKDRVQRQLSRDLAREVECWEDALEVLAGWLASCTDARMPEAQGSFLRSLDALEAADGVGAESSLERRSSEESRSRRADVL